MTITEFIKQAREVQAQASGDEIDSYSIENFSAMLNAMELLERALKHYADDERWERFSIRELKGIEARDCLAEVEELLK